MTTSSLPADYLERVYAGVLGKIVGVYLGRPFEGWAHEEILAKLGEVEYYVHDRLGVPLVVTDDDISGTFTFLRALPDYGSAPNLSSEQIGQTWLNYIIENKSVLWWGGMGMSTEHTAYLRLKHGIKAPASGSIKTNGQVVAEQIGAQIFIDGWGLVNPGDPERAADFARRAASVSHDGEAVYAAQVVAALVAQAFVERDIDRLFETAVLCIPKESLVARMIADIRNWHAQGLDWREGFAEIKAHYGYDRYGGNCHVVPNHALIIHALLHGRGDFDESLKVVNTCGWDTDCNSGNVGCILGVRNGLAGIDAGRDWRGPVADKIYLPTADGGRCITDAATEAIQVANIGRALRGQTALAPKNGARFHFDLPGSIQGFYVAGAGTAEITNVEGHSELGARSLCIVTSANSARIATETFPSPAARKMPGYSLMASPTIHAGQRLTGRVSADSNNHAVLEVRLYLGEYGSNDAIHPTFGDPVSLDPGENAGLALEVPDTGGYPIAEVGIDVSGGPGTAYLDWLTWSGTPNVTFQKTEGSTWKEQWICGVTEHAAWGEPFRLVQNEGTGLLITGCREWTDYRVEASVTPHLVASGGIAARVQGMRRYYALLLVRGGGVQLVKALEGDTVLAEAPFGWELGETHALALEVASDKMRGYVDGELLLEYEDRDKPFSGGGIALILTEGRMATHEVNVRPL